MIQKLFRKVDNVSALQFFQLFRYGTLVLLGVFFAKIGVPKSSIASLEILIFISGLVSFFWVNSLIQLLLSEYKTLTTIEQKKAIFRYFATFQSFSIVAALATIILFKGESSSLVALFIVFNTPSLLNEYILYLNERKNALLGYGVLSSLLLIALCIGLIVFLVLILNEPIEKCFDAILLVFLLVAFLKWLFSLVLLFRYSSFDINIVSTMQWSTLAILVIGFLLSGSSEYITGWFVKHNANASAFTTFRYGTKEMPLFTLLAAALSNSMISIIAANEKEGIALLKQKALSQMHIFFPIAIVLTVIAPKLFSLVFSSAFYESGQLFSLTMLLTIPRLLFPQPILHAKNAQKWLTVAMICEIGTLVLLSFLTYPFWGLYGLILSIIFSYAVEKLVLVFVLKQKFNITLSQYLPINWFAFYSLILLLSYFLSLIIN